MEVSVSGPTSLRAPRWAMATRQGRKPTNLGTYPGKYLEFLASGASEGKLGV